MNAHTHDSYHDGRKRIASLRRTYERYQGKVALLAEWENCSGADPDYIRQLKKEVQTYRNQLRYKNAL